MAIPKLAGLTPAAAGEAGSSADPVSTAVEGLELLCRHAASLAGCEAAAIVRSEGGISFLDVWAGMQPPREVGVVLEVAGTEALTIEDAAVHGVAEPHIRRLAAAGFRFLAARPFRGLKFGATGSLVVLDPAPRRLTGLDEANLAMLVELGAAQFRTAQLVRSMETQRKFVERLEHFAQIGTWERNLVTGEVVWSPSMFRIYGLPEGQPPSSAEIERIIPSEISERMRETSERGETWDLTFPITTPAGEERWLRSVGGATLAEGRRTMLAGTVQDVTEQREREQTIRRLAQRDPLTDLPNRTLFHERLETALKHARRTSLKVALCLLDLDHFKDINDTLGHGAGDAVLGEVGRRLVGAVREVDTVARLGGDEFAVVLTDIADERGLQAALQRLLAVFEAAVPYGRRELSAAGSMGVTVFPDDGSTPAQLLQNADIALYRSKNGGRGCFTLFDPSMRRRLEARSQLAARFRRAIIDDELVPYYQPIVDLRRGTVASAEALLRWRHPKQGLVGPSTFAEIFEHSEIAAATSRKVIDLVTRDLAVWRSKGLPIGRIGINVTSSDLRSPRFVEDFVQKLAGRGLVGHDVTMELTENVLLGREAGSINRILRDLDGLGVELALDDFGTGHASLIHLKQFPVSQIKIDQSFVRDMTIDRDDASIVWALVTLGASLGIPTVAEGVETEVQARMLLDAGCDFAQGYFFGRPMPAEDLGAKVMEFEASPWTVAPAPPPGEARSA